MPPEMTRRRAINSSPSSRVRHRPQPIQGGPNDAEPKAHRSSPGPVTTRDWGRRWINDDHTTTRPQYIPTPADLRTVIIISRQQVPNHPAGSRRVPVYVGIESLLGLVDRYPRDWVTQSLLLLLVSILLDQTLHSTPRGHVKTGSSKIGNPEATESREQFQFRENHGPGNNRR